MLRIIGLMVGGYILFRMIEALFSRHKHAFVKVCAGLVIVFTAFCMYTIVVPSADSPQSPWGLVR